MAKLKTELAGHRKVAGDALLSAIVTLTKIKVAVIEKRDAPIPGSWLCRAPFEPWRG